MISLKVVTLFAAAVMIINSSISQYTSNCPLVFTAKNGRVEVSKRGYAITSNTSGYDLIILDRKKIPAIKKLVRPQIEFCVGTHYYTAKGNPVLSSFIPAGARFFFSFDKDSTMLLSPGNRIPLTDTSKVLAHD